MRLNELFFPQEPPTQAQLQSGRGCIVAEGAVAAVIYSIGTGNFLAGYLSWLGASLSLCAAVAMIPQFGCVLQFISPFVFERLHHRKLAIWLLCVIFRFSLGGMLLVPLLGGGAAALPVVLALYVLGFLAAGIVTPGLQHMVLALAPQEHRGSFFAHKDILATCVNGAATLVLGRQLDYFTAAGTPYTGYLVLAVVCLGLAALDAFLLANVHEQPVDFVARLRPVDMLRPVRDAAYRPLLLYTVLGGLMGGFSAPFLSAYQLRVLGLSHTFITTVGVVAALAGMLGSWVWGRYADNASWARIVRLCAGGTLGCTLGWGLLRPATAWLAPVLMIGTAACAGGSAMAGMNLQYACSPAASKTTYISVTSALASMAACASAFLGTALQPLLAASVGELSIPLLFFASGVGGLLNLLLYGNKLPDAR